MVEWLKPLFKRNTPVSLKKREIQILHLLSEGLNYYEIADALLISHEATKKDIQSIYRELNVHCKEEALKRARALKILDGPQDKEQRQAWILRPLPIAALAVTGILAALLAIYLARPLVDPCAEFADLTQKKWEDISATWEDAAGSGVVVREASPTEYFGKVESETLTVDLSRCPILHIDTAEVEPEAGYTIQILDKRSDQTTDVVRDNHAGDWVINLVQEVSWQQPGLQAFTINVWVSGEGKAVTFGHISIGSE